MLLSISCFASNAIHLSCEGVMTEITYNDEPIPVGSYFILNKQDKTLEEAATQADLQLDSHEKTLKHAFLSSPTHYTTKDGLISINRHTLEYFNNRHMKTHGICKVVTPLI